MPAFLKNYCIALVYEKNYSTEESVCLVDKLKFWGLNILYVNKFPYTDRKYAYVRYISNNHYREIGFCKKRSSYWCG